MQNRTVGKEVISLVNGVNDEILGKLNVKYLLTTSVKRIKKADANCIRFCILKN